MPFFLGMVWLYRGRSYHRLINNTALQPTNRRAHSCRFSASQLNRAPSSEEVSHVNGNVVVATGVPLEQTSPAAGPDSRPIEDVSGFQARPAGKPQARMAAQLDVVKARALSPASRALVMSAAGSRV